MGNSDVAITLDLSRALLHGTVRLSPDCRACVVGAGGMRTSQYGVGHSLYLVPYVLAGRVVARCVPRFPPEMWEEFFASFANVPVILLLLSYLSRAWRRLGASDPRIQWGLLLFTFATLLGPYAKLPPSDSLMALATFAAWYHWTTPSGPRSRGVAAGIWLGIALLSRRQADAVVPILVGLALVDAIPSRRLREFAGLLAGLVPAILGRLAYNFARFGSPWLERHRGLSTEKIAASVSHGHTRIWDILFSDSEGIVVYALIPILVAALGARGLWRASRRDAIAAATIVTGGIAFLGILPFSPGVSFGARYLVYLVAFLGLAWPFVRFPAGMPARIAWGIPVACSMVLMASGFAIDPLPVYLRIQRQSTPVGQFHAIALEWRRILSPTDPPDDPGLEASGDWRHDPFRRPDFWWCHLWARSHGAKPTPPPAPGPSVKP